MPNRAKPETIASRRIVASLARLGYTARRIHSGAIAADGGYMQLGPKGWPDYVIPVRGGRVVWWESKTEDGMASREQKEVHKTLRRLGHWVYLGSDFNMLYKFLRQAELWADSAEFDSETFNPTAKRSRRLIWGDE